VPANIENKDAKMQRHNVISPCPRVGRAHQFSKPCRTQWLTPIPIAVARYDSSGYSSRAWKQRDALSLPGGGARANVCLPGITLIRPETSR
jgi:hypothetical protein